MAYFAGHRDFGTTRRHVHPNLESGKAAMERAQSYQKDARENAANR
jgi:hypothetical protein